MPHSCTKCGASVEPSESWDFGEEYLCQMCWEAYTSATWWAMLNGEPEPTIEEWRP